MMRSRRGILWIVLGTLGFMHGQALTGVVRSAEEGPLEGVLVSAQRINTPVTITVVSPSLRLSMRIFRCSAS